MKNIKTITNSRKQAKLAISIVYLMIILTTSSLSQAGTFEEGFGVINQLQANGWVLENRSDFIGDGSWFQGNPLVGPAQAGAPTSYIIGSTAQSGGDVLCDWLILPDIGFVEQLNFFTRTDDNLRGADRLVVVYSPSGTINTGACVSTNNSTQQGGLIGDFGDFEVLMAINPSLNTGVYPEDWTEINIPVNGDGRLALVYFVDNLSNPPFNGNLIAIDSISIGAGIPVLAPVNVPGLRLFGISFLILLMVGIVFKRRNTFTLEIRL